MFNPEKFTREELYQAIWAEPIQKVAKSIGLSDVGLAKVCRRLNIPHPGRGDWARLQSGQHPIQPPLPRPKKDEPRSYHIYLPGTGGGAGWAREAVEQLTKEGVKIPALPETPSEARHPLIAKYYGQLEAHGLEVQDWLHETTCLAISVSAASLARGLSIVQRLFEAFETEGLKPEVRRPDPNGKSR